MQKPIIKKLSLLLFFTFIFVFISFIIATLLCKKYNCNREDVLAYEGMLILVVAAFTLMDTSSLGIINSVADMHNPPDSYDDVESLANEKETQVRNFFRNNSIIRLSVKTQILILSGIFILFISYFYDKIF
jgi:hypothetical protein